MPSRIIIWIQGGVIQGVTGIPTGVTVEARDYDTQDLDSECLKDAIVDEDGDKYFASEWESDQAEECRVQATNGLYPDCHDALTRSQIQAIDAIQEAAVRRSGYFVKRFRVKNIGSVVSAYVVVERFGDEGTLGQYLNQRHGHFFVGRGGKIKAMSGGDDVSKGLLRKYPLIYGWR